MQRVIVNNTQNVVTLGSDAALHRSELQTQAVFPSEDSHPSGSFSPTHDRPISAKESNNVKRFTWRQTMCVPSVYNYLAIIICI